MNSMSKQSSRIFAARKRACVLRDAATLYKVDADVIALKVKQEFAAKEKARAEKKPSVKMAPAKKSGGKKTA